MAIGAGKYDDLCTIVRERCGGKLVMVVVVGGDRGEGFSIQTVDPALVAGIPIALRNIAAEIEATLAVHGDRPPGRN